LFFLFVLTRNSVIQIKDDGTGLQEMDKTKRGRGVRIMEHRATYLGELLALGITMGNVITTVV